MTIEITKEQFEAYERVRQEGMYNMFDAVNASQAAGLSKDVYFAIIKQYTELCEKWPDVRNG